jgi:hypothetical protein
MKNVMPRLLKSARHLEGAKLLHLKDRSSNEDGHTSSVTTQTPPPQKKTPLPLVRERTLPAEGPPLLDGI